MSKKCVLFAWLLVAMLVMTACVKGERQEAGTTTKYQILLNSGSCVVYTFQDSETGVWYISTTKGLTPRLNSDGSLYVTDK